MTRTKRLSRRHVLAAVLATLDGLRAGPAGAQGESPSDRGIGGTGVIGTIRRFGSIEVNGLRITFPRTVQVRIDGQRVGLGRLKLGHVVQVLAHRKRGILKTHRIDAWSEVVGAVEEMAPDSLKVLGQRVLVAGLGTDVQLGDIVAVSGVRRLDETIVASLVERRETQPAQVAGVPRHDRGGMVRIGMLPLIDLSPDFIGRRVLVTGSISGGALLVRRSAVEPFGLLKSRPTSFSIEDYVAFADGHVQLGSGLPVEGHDTASSLVSEEVRAVVSATLGSDDRLVVHAVRPEGAERGNSGSVPGARPASPTQQGPAPFGAPPPSMGSPPGPSFGGSGAGGPNGAGPTGAASPGGPSGPPGSNPGRH